jgi:DNA-binding CsgD family transcriptional regulator
VGAKYGHGLNRLNQAVLALLARLYADVPAAPPTLTTQERNARAHQANAARDSQIRHLRAEGKSLKELARLFGISIGRVYQIVNQQ